MSDMSEALLCVLQVDRLTIYGIAGELLIIFLLVQLWRKLSRLENVVPNYYIIASIIILFLKLPRHVTLLFVPLCIVIPSVQLITGLDTYLTIFIVYLHRKLGHVLVVWKFIGLLFANDIWVLLLWLLVLDFKRFVSLHLHLDAYLILGQCNIEAVLLQVKWFLSHFLMLSHQYGLFLLVYFSSGHLKGAC